MIAHPTDGSALADRFSEYVCVDARCVIAVRTSKYGGARLAEGTITKIVPLIEAIGTWHATGPNARTPFWREDQFNKQRQTEPARPGASV
jgi:hypothetical protein